MKKHFENVLLQVLEQQIVDDSDDYCAAADTVTDSVCMDHPELEEKYGRQDITEIAELLLMSELHPESERLSALYKQFDKDYFDSRLPDYAIKVVYELWYQTEEGLEPTGSKLDHVHRTIYIRYTYLYDDGLIEVLLNEMAALSTNEEKWDTEKWRQEIIRLRDAGAPVGR